MTKGKPPLICNQCDKNRDNDSNHWFYLYTTNLSRTGEHELHIGAIAELTCRREEGLEDSHEIHHACGVDCLIRLVGRWEEAGQLPEDGTKERWDDDEDDSEEDEDDEVERKAKKRAL